MKTMTYRKQTGGALLLPETMMKPGYLKKNLYRQVSYLRVHAEEIIDHHFPQPGFSSAYRATQFERLYSYVRTLRQIILQMHPHYNTAPSRAIAGSRVLCMNTANQQERTLYITLFKEERVQCPNYVHFLSGEADQLLFRRANEVVKLPNEDEDPSQMLILRVDYLGFKRGS